MATREIRSAVLIEAGADCVDAARDIRALVEPLDRLEVRLVEALGHPDQHVGPHTGGVRHDLAEMRMVATSVLVLDGNDSPSGILGPKVEEEAANGYLTVLAYFRLGFRSGDYEVDVDQVSDHVDVLR